MNIQRVYSSDVAFTPAVKAVQARMRLRHRSQAARPVRIDSQRRQHGGAQRYS